MNNRCFIFLIFIMLAGCTKEPATDASVEALRASPEGFRQAAPGMTINLPRDMGAHPDFRLEWWYLTANLKTVDGELFGVQWTLFRTGIRPGPYGDKQPGWQRNVVWFAHAALSRPDDHHFADRAARGGTGQAGVDTQPFRAWIDHWQLESLEDKNWVLSVDGEDFRYRLQVQPSASFVLNGDRGFSAKSAGGGGSMYFSFPLQVTGGEVQIGTEKYNVSGQGWFDREWSSQYLKSDQEGWDWMALHLDDGQHLMLFRVRGAEDYFFGTLVAADGAAQTLGSSKFSLRPIKSRATRYGEVPVVWKLQVPSEKIDLKIQSWPGEYWNSGALRYWEGPVTVSGSHTGEGYLEMTGYGK